MRVSSYYYNLIEAVGDPIWRQCIPDPKELCDPYGKEDPLNEEGDSPVPWLTHRYPDRLLMCVSNQCATYCRFCTRKRKVGDPTRQLTEVEVLRQIEYVREHKEVRDIVVSGGDPLMLSDERLELTLSQLRQIPHVEILRIGTRVPCARPQVNDDADTMKALTQKLLTARVRPYYLFQCDPVEGTYHFRTSVERGLDILQELIGHTSGLAVPHFVIDAPGGGGKVPILPSYLRKLDKEKVVLRNYQGRRFEYIQAEPGDVLLAKVVIGGGGQIVAEDRSSVQS
jgi:lysine 2,3-aminomutase